MDGLSAAVNAAIQLTGSVVRICGGYIKEVKDARKDIVSLQRVVAGLKVALEDLSSLHDPRRMRLSIPRHWLMVHIIAFQFSKT